MLAAIRDPNPVLFFEQMFLYHGIREPVPEGEHLEVLGRAPLAPLDVETLVDSVRRTGRLVVAHEAWRVGGIGAEVAATVADEAFGALKAPIKRVGARHVPIPSAATLRDLALPSDDDLIQAVRAALAYR
jgi:pyruvate dehydrogenase E1 component beta subunit